MAVEFLQDTNINGTFQVKDSGGAPELSVSDGLIRVHSTLRLDSDILASASSGTTGQVLTSNGSGAAVTWETLTAQGVTSVSAGNGMNFTTITGTGPVTMGTPGTLTSATTNGVTATSHTHNITTGISNTNIVKINSTTVATGEYARFTTTGLESRTAAEVATDIGAVTGSGAATRVAFWNGTNSLASDVNLYWDNTNDRLGIGTSTPGSSLEVSGLTQTDKFRYDYPTSDGVYNGEIADFGAVSDSPAPSEGDIVYLNSSGLWVAAQANNSGARNLLGFYDGTNVILRGPVRSGTGGGGERIPTPTTPPTDGEPLYLSPDVAGEIVTLSQLPTIFAAGEYIRIIGHIIDYSLDSFYFNPDSTWVKKA